MNVQRLGVYYAFCLPIAAVVIGMEIGWRLMLLDALQRRAR